jgi:CO dehydrogenase/acetyl-CoA synthase alpha subunit
MKKRITRPTQRVHVDAVTGETHVTVLDAVQNAYDETWRYIERRWGEFVSIEEGQRFLRMVAERVEGMRMSVAKLEERPQ